MRLILLRFIKKPYTPSHYLPYKIRVKERRGGNVARKRFATHLEFLSENYFKTHELVACVCLAKNDATTTTISADFQYTNILV